VITMRKLINLLLILLLAISAESVLGQNEEHNQHAPSTSQAQATSSAAVQSVTGCVVKSDRGFLLKTDSDSYPIETDQDLSRYVNKQVKVTGILEHHTGAPPSATSGSTAVITDLRLRMVATVVGNCNQPSK
jgi:hypothetical protein